MRLEQLCQTLEALDFPVAGAREHPDRDVILRARVAVTAAVADDSFLVDCLSSELRVLENNRLRRGLVPFFTMPVLGVRFAFGYWPPGGTPGPHEHTAWTITAVCRNELEVVTYHREESYRRRELVPKSRFHAPAGRVGFNYEPCIHEPKNASSDWSLSLHVSSPRDGEPACDFNEPLPAIAAAGTTPAAYDHPYVKVMSARQRRRAIHQLARILASTHVPQASPLLAKCYDLGSSATREWIELKAPDLVKGRTGNRSWILTRTDARLILRPRIDGTMVALEVVTPSGLVDELLIGNEAHAAVAFAARESTFDVRALPGRLSEDDRFEIAHALEETGLFERTMQ